MDESVRRVQGVAKLARLDLTRGLDGAEADAALARLASQFDDIVALMDTLAEVDTEGVEPLYWPLGAPAAPDREDAARRIRERAEILGNAPDQDGSFFVVPKIV